MMKFADGSSYEGDWNQGNFEGKGAYLWSDGCKYVGQYSDGKRHGILN
jgi:hypothetical protein